MDLSVGVAFVIVIDKKIEQLSELHIPRGLCPEIGKMRIGGLLSELKTDDQQVLHLALFGLFDFLFHRVEPFFYNLRRYGDRATESLKEEKGYDEEEYAAGH